MKLVFLPAALLALGTPLAFAQTVPPAIQAALADSARPATDTERDAARHPGEILAFAGVAPGQKVADFVMGGGYWTRILARAVGDTGHVYGYQPAEFTKGKLDDAVLAIPGTYKDVTLSNTPFAEVAFPEPLDLIVTVQNWHDLHLKRFPADLSATVAAKLYAALKPGGVLLVIDHAANADPALTAPDTLHRIDPAAARAEIEKAGFRFEGALPVLHNPADPHTAKVFDPSIRGKTDQFVFKFRKPR